MGNSGKIIDLRSDTVTKPTPAMRAALERARFLDLQKDLREKVILIAGRDQIRLVTHLDVTAEDIQRVLVAFKAYFSKAGGRLFSA